MEYARPPPALVLKGGPEDRAEAWRNWIKQFKAFLNASGMYKSEIIGLGKFLITHIGPDGYAIYSTFKMEGQDDDIDVLIQKFEEHFRTKTNTMMARFHFFTRNQKEGENIDAYVKALRLLSQHCNFEHLEESLIRDRIVCGLIDSGVSYKLLRTDDLSLDKAVKICKASEVSYERKLYDIEEMKLLDPSGAGDATRGFRPSGSAGSANQTRESRSQVRGATTPQPHGSAAKTATVLIPSTPQKKKSTKAEAPVVCNSCNSVINGRIVTALNKKWHPEHFTCNTCRKPIDGAKFHQHDGGVHCVPCFAAHHSPRCHGCGEPITDRVIQALGVSWHANHFVCGGCKKELGGGGFMEQAGRPYCSGCYADKFAARCNGCGSPITDKAIIALDAKWHRDCFTCMKCRNPVTDATFSVMDNKPLCGKCA